MTTHSIHRFPPTAGLVALLLAFGAPVVCPAQSRPAKEPRAGNGAVEPGPDDRLTGEEARLVAELSSRFMPELVEAMLADRPRALHGHIARAYARAGLESPEPGLREPFCTKALEWYQRTLELRNDASWLVTEDRRCEAAQWLMEYADLIVRFSCAGDLDRFELTSGLEFDRGRVQGKLNEAAQAYREADEILKELTVGLRTQEEKFLLLGIAEKIERLSEERELNAAWAGAYLGMVMQAGQAGREAVLSAALAGFDKVARDARDPARKYNALIGSGIALRESGQAEESAACLNRVLASTAGAGAMARARYEKVRTLLRSGQFEAARQEIKALGAMGKSGEAGGGAFYVKLSPLLDAYSYLVQASARVENSPEMQRLRETALSKFNAVAAQGGPWPGIVEVYLSSLAGPAKNPGQLSEEELRTSARRLMSKEKYAEAAAALNELAARKAGTADDSFNLGVCLFQGGNIRDAAERFDDVERKAGGELGDRAAEYAYRCRKQLAAAGKTRDALDALAKSAQRLAARHSNHPLAAEAEFVGGLAYQEAGEYGEAIKAFRAIKPGTSNYWAARRNEAVCLTAAANSKKLKEADRARQLREAAGAWMRLGGDLQGAASAAGGNPVKEWQSEARDNAASLYADESVKDYKQALVVLGEGELSDRGAMLEVACLRAMGDWAAVSKRLDELLAKVGGQEAGPIVLALAADMDGQASKLAGTGRPASVEKFAAEALPILGKLDQWLGERKASADQRSAVRGVRVNVLKLSGRLKEALDEVERLMEAEPENGLHVRSAAQVLEQLAKSQSGAEATASLDRAEALWARLLEDNQLRENAPAVYWEARYSWLAHQMRHGHGDAVAKAIDAERVWFPELGGPPWQGRLLELADRARPGEKGP